MDQIDPVQEKQVEKQMQRSHVDVLDPVSLYNAGARSSPDDRTLVVVGEKVNSNQVGQSNKSKREGPHSSKLLR